MSKVSSNNPSNNRTHTPSSSTSQPASAFNYAAAAAKAKATSNPNSNAPKAPATATSSPSLGPTSTAPNSGAVTPIPNGSKPASGAQTPAPAMSAGKGAPRPPSSTRGSHMKQGSISASRPINLKDPTPVNFGTIDDSNATLSSSPAAPPVLGARKPPVFGSITDTPPSTGDAAPASAAVSSSTAAPSSSATAPAATAAPAANTDFDFDSLFGAKPDIAPEAAASSPAGGLAPEPRRTGSLAGSPAASGLTPPAQPGQHGGHASHLSTASRPFSPNHAAPPPNAMSPYGQPSFGQHPFSAPHLAHSHHGHHPHPHGGIPSGHAQSPGAQQPPSQYPSQPGSGSYPNGTPSYTQSKNASSGPMMHQGPGTPGPGGFQPNGPGGPPQSGQQTRGQQNAFGPMHGGQRPPLPTQHPSHGSQSSQQQGGKSNYPASPKVSTAPPSQPQQAMQYQYYGQPQPQYYGGYYGPPMPNQQYPGMSPGPAPSGPSPGPASAVASPASQTRALPPLTGTPSSQSAGTPSWQPPHYSASPATAQSTMPPTPTGSDFRPSSAVSQAPSSTFNAGAIEFKPSAATGFKPVSRTSAAVLIRKPPADMVKKPAAPATPTPAPASKEPAPAEAAAASATTSAASEAPKSTATPSTASRAIVIKPPPTDKKDVPAPTEKKQEQPSENAKPKESVVPQAKETPVSVAAEKKIDESAASVAPIAQKASEPEQPKSNVDAPAKAKEAAKIDDASEKAKAVDTPVAKQSVDAAAKGQAAPTPKPAMPVPPQEPAKVEPPPSSTKAEAPKDSAPSQETSKAPSAAEPTATATSSLSSSTTTEPGESKSLSGIDTKASSLEPTRESTPVSAAPSLATVDESAAVEQATNGVNGADAEKKKRTVPPLDLSHSRKASQEGSPQTASVQALASAKPILDLNKVTYPADIQSPSAELNAGANPGEYRYDRTFMLQFMNICKEKPDGLPSLEAIGMIEDGSATPGGGLSRPASMSGANRRASAGIPNASRQPSGVFPGMMGSRASSFAAAPMGQFVKGGSGASMTSEERFQQSQQNRASGTGLPGAPFGVLPGRPGGAMSRTPSVGPGMALGPGGNRRSQQGRKRAPQPMLSTGEVVQPLEVSENRWQPMSASSAAATDPTSAEVVQRKVKSLLNKLTLENFDSISLQILEWANKSEKETDGRILRQVIALIFEKATDEAFWSSLYARLCRYLMEKLSGEVRDHSLSDQSGGHVGGGHLFRKYLLTRCQEDYERGWSARDEAVAAAAAKDKEIADKKAAEEAEKKAAEGEQEATGGSADAEKKKKDGAEGEKPKEAELLSDEYYVAQKAKRRGLGLVSFIGELYKLGMLKDGIMHECVVKLLSNVEDPEEEMVESLCRLMRTVGKSLDSAAKGEQRMDIYFNRMAELLRAPLDSRLKFMVQDVIDLRKEKWVARNEQTGPKTIAEIHQQAEAEKQQKEMDDRRNASAGKGLPNLSNQLGRTGSRRGQGRQDSFQQTADGWNTVGTAAPRAPAKIGDMTQLGRIRDSGRSSMFKKREDKTPGKTSNPFDMLVNADAGPSGPQPETPSERPRLSLLPRTKPMPDAAADSPQPEAGEPEAEAASGEMPADVKQSIKNSVEEFFAVRNIGEGVAVFSTLAKAWHVSLVTALTEKVLEKKADDVTLAASLYKQLQTDNVISSNNFKDAFAPLVKTAPDISADVPNLYKFFGILLVAASLQEADVTALSEAMESEEEDVEDAQQQLLEAYKKASA